MARSSRFRSSSSSLIRHLFTGGLAASLTGHRMNSNRRTVTKSVLQILEVTMGKWLIFTAIATSICRADDYCTGWERGWEAGYCYNKFSCISPIAPLCPIPSLNETGYQGGYNRGFIAGQARRADKEASSSYQPSSTFGYQGYDRQDKLNQSMADLGNAIAEAKRAKEAEKAAKLASERAAEDRARSERAYQVELQAKAIAFSNDYPGQPNPYRDEIDRIEAEKKAAAQKEWVAAEKRKQADKRDADIGRTLFLAGSFIAIGAVTIAILNSE